MKIHWEYERSECGQASTELGRSLLSGYYGRSRRVLLGGEAPTPTVECSKPEEILSVNVMYLKN